MGNHQNIPVASAISADIPVATAISADIPTAYAELIIDNAQPISDFNINNYSLRSGRIRNEGFRIGQMERDSIVNTRIIHFDPNYIPRDIIEPSAPPLEPSAPPLEPSAPPHLS